MEYQYEAIFALVNTGFADVVMEAAKAEGARGGTVLKARGTSHLEYEKKYGVVITPDKEMLLIIVSSKIKDNILQAIYKAAGINTDGHGIVFTVPVNDVAGMKFED